MNHDTYGDFPGYQEWPWMIFDTTRLHKTWFQEVDVLRKLKILTESPRGGVVKARIQNLGWTQLEYTSTIMMVNVENYSFGNHHGRLGDIYIYIYIYIYITAAWGPHDLWNLPAWRRVRRTTWWQLKGSSWHKYLTKWPDDHGSPEGP